MKQSFLSVGRHKNAIYRFSAPFLSPYFGGIGSILMFHRITNGISGPRVGYVENLLETSPRLLENIVRYLRKKRYAFVSMDEVRDILRKGRRVPKFVAVTFDDGYRDVYQTAFPYLCSENIPFTLYLTTDLPDAKAVPWAHLLETRLLREKHIAFELGSRYVSFSLDTQAQRESAFNEISARFESTSGAELERISENLFGREAIRKMRDELYIQWDELEEMSRHPITTIGAHTVTHPILRNLQREEARTEISESKSVIEKRLKLRVRHFAFPYGSQLHAGKREFELARGCGFDTAVTTRLANLFPEHTDSLHCLPRIYGETLYGFKAALSGAVSAFRYRGRRVITE